MRNSNFVVIGLCEHPSMVDLLVRSGAVGSRTKAKRLIKDGAVRLRYPWPRGLPKTYKIEKYYDSYSANWDVERYRLGERLYEDGLEICDGLIVVCGKKYFVVVRDDNLMPP